MKLKIYAVRDRATDQYDRPMFFLAHGQAVRGFTDEVNRKAENNALYDHPDDYDLYYLGEYDTDAGTFETKGPEMICIGKNVSTKG